MLLLAPAYELLLIGEGTEPPNRRCPISSHYIGRRGLGLPFWGEGGGVRGPGGCRSTLVLTCFTWPLSFAL
jgi:hypothetical protein